MEGDFIRKVPDKWEPGERAAMVKHKDNLLPPGPIEDNRDHSRPGAGDRAPVVKYPDNMKMEGEFEKRRVEEFQAAERMAAVKQSDHLKMEGNMRYMIYSLEVCTIKH